MLLFWCGTVAISESLGGASRDISFEFRVCIADYCGMILCVLCEVLVVIVCLNGWHSCKRVSASLFSKKRPC